MPHLKPSCIEEERDREGREGVIAKDVGLSSCLLGDVSSLPPTRRILDSAIVLAPGERNAIRESCLGAILVLAQIDGL